IEVFANANDGRTVRISDLLSTLGYVKKTDRTISEEQAEYDEHLVSKAKRAKDTLRNTMADLGRILRGLVQTDDESAVFSSASDFSYQGAFTAGYVIRNDAGRTTFVWGQNL